MSTVSYWNKKNKQAYYYKSTKELPELKEGDLVRVKPWKISDKRKPWLQAKVEGKVNIQSYQVRTEDDRVYRENQQHLQHTREQPEERTTDFEIQPPEIETSATREQVERPSQDHVVVQPNSATDRSHGKLGRKTSICRVNGCYVRWPTENTKWESC